jgi:hypothetical protein
MIKLRMIIWGGHVAQIGERIMRAGNWLNSKNKEANMKAKRMWEIIKMDLREIGWSDINWTDLAQDRGH